MHADNAAVERVREKAGRKGADLLPEWLVQSDSAAAESQPASKVGQQ